MQTNKGTNIIVQLSFSFALDILRYCQHLFEIKQFVIAKQLLKCGTSIGANVREAQNAESRADFIHKFKLAAKEADETQYWLELCQASEQFPDCSSLQSQTLALAKIISKIIGSSRRI